MGAGRAGADPAVGDPAAADPAVDDPAVDDPAVDDRDRRGTDPPSIARARQAIDLHSIALGQEAIGLPSIALALRVIGRLLIARGQPAIDLPTVDLVATGPSHSTDPDTKGTALRSSVRDGMIGRQLMVQGNQIGHPSIGHAENSGRSLIDLAEIQARRKSARGPTDLRASGHGRTVRDVTLDRRSTAVAAVVAAAAASVGRTRIAPAGSAQRAGATGRPGTRAGLRVRSTHAPLVGRTSTRASSSARMTS